jgi:hypothetical protein
MAIRSDLPLAAAYDKAGVAAGHHTCRTVEPSSTSRSCDRIEGRASDTGAAGDPWEPDWEQTTTATGPRQAMSSHCDYS